MQPDLRIDLWPQLHVSPIFVSSCAVRERVLQNCRKKCWLEGTARRWWVEAIGSVSLIRVLLIILTVLYFTMQFFLVYIILFRNASLFAAFLPGWVIWRLITSANIWQDKAFFSISLPHLLGAYVYQFFSQSDELFL